MGEVILPFEKGVGGFRHVHFSFPVQKYQADTELSKTKSPGPFGKGVSRIDTHQIRVDVVLARQCLQQRIGSLAQLKQILKDWEKQRNAEPHPVSWRFTTEDARIKLRRLYPVWACEK